MKKRLMAVAVALVFIVAALCGVLPVSATTVEEGETHNTLRQKIEVCYDAPAGTDEWVPNGTYTITSSGHKVGNWGAYDGWKIVGSTDGAMQYDFVGTEGTARISQFYTMLSNFTKGLTRITLHGEKLQSGQILDLGMKFYDVISAKNVGMTDFTDLYNAAPEGEFSLQAYTDLSLIGSPDSFILWAKADTAAAQFKISSVTFEWGETAIATADGYFRGLESGFNIVFDKMARDGENKEFVNMPVNGYSAEIGAGYDSGRHGDYGFNHGSIRAYNDAEGEYLGFGKGTGADANSVGGIWIKFPLDISREKVNLRFTIMKKVAGDCNELKFEFCSTGDGGSNVAAVIGNSHNFPGIPQLNDVPAGEWVTYDIRDLDITDIATFDGLGIWVDATGAEGQELYIRNLSVYYDECGADRSFTLTADDKDVNGLEFDAETGVSVQSDYYAEEFIHFDLSAAAEGISATYEEDTEAGVYNVVAAVRKAEDATVDKFAVTLLGAEEKGVDLSDAIASADAGEWVVLRSGDIEMANGSEGFRLEAEGSDRLDIAYVAAVCEQQYIEKDVSFGVSNVLVRDFTAMDNMGVDEYDFSQNGFPEIGNWSDSFPDLRAQGQKVVRDTDGTPVMKIYRRTEEEIAQAQEEFDWPEGTPYVPADKSHFFVTAPVSAGYFTLSITAKTDENFLGTTDFSLEGYMGSEPWWKLANFTEELNAAPKGEWKTYTAEVYIPRAIDSIKICIETRYENSDMYIKNVSVTRKQTTAEGYFNGETGGDLQWALINSGDPISSVTLDGTAVPSDAYVLQDDQFTLKESYLSTLDNGTYDFVLSNDEGSITVTVYTSKIAPVVSSENLIYNLKKPGDLTIDVDLRGSGLSYLELNAAELEEDVQYSYDAQAGKITLHASAFEGLTEEGEATLLIKTRAGEAQVNITLENKGSASLAIVLGVVGGVIVVAAVITAVAIVRKKRASGK